MTALKLVSDSMEEPVTVDEVATHLRLDLDNPFTLATERTYIGALITVARQMAEAETNRAFTLQTWNFICDKFPGSSPLVLPIGQPVYEVSIIYKDTSGLYTVLDSTTYKVTENLLPELVLVSGETWPETYPEREAVSIAFTCGYQAIGPQGSPGRIAVPEPVKLWIKIKVGELYENRERSNTDKVSVNTFLDNLLDRWRISIPVYSGWSGEKIRERTIL